MSRTDLIVAGGTVIDGGRAEQLDLAITSGRFSTLTADGGGARVIRADGLYVAPGFIDIHTHVYTWGMPTAIDSSLAGVHAGVTTVVDAGSAGPSTYPGLRHMIDDHATTRVIPFLNVARSGLAFQPEISFREDLDTDALRATIAANRDQIAGIKIRAIGRTVSVFGATAVEIAKEVAADFALPVMVHIGETQDASIPPITADVLTLLESGDILTHAFTGQPGSLQDRKSLDLALEAQRRGVVMDVGHGVRNFSHQAAIALLRAGLRVDTISTDMAARPRKGPAFSLAETMSKCLSLGIPLQQVVASVTRRAADAIRRADLGRIDLGLPADLTLFELVRGSWEVADSMGETWSIGEAIVPRLAVKDGQLHPIEWGPHSTGWLPPTA